MKSAGHTLMSGMPFSHQKIAYHSNFLDELTSNYADVESMHSLTVTGQFN